ncbi:heparan-alpha-glucosaminide N-acetyltransferase [Aureimonas sp. ME7]|uniref:heparan-alpha-glucosaminide N-acetyltransferase n=1 Tax=Aureimonas sp. ME7 TaxID=2744252 RepID=UPI0015F778AA|nr:heparan-alpha-glucosaminide N-acetyltransferase [Aureimonas sp. ME7]
MREQPAPTFGSRIEALDVARGVALLAMASYHFTWDLEFFGYLDPGFAQVGGWRLYARAIATSFLVMVGIGLHLAHGRNVRWPSFRKRLVQIVAGAAAISVATYLFTPATFVFFGILHLIALASVLGLVAIRLPAIVNLGLTVVLVLLPAYVSTPWTDPRWLAWIGLSADPPISNDFVPLVPWLAPVLTGIATSQLLERFGGWATLRRINGRFGPAHWLGRLGHHSLAFYLIHQPVSIGLIALAAYIAPPDQTAAFDRSCRQSCLETRDGGFCDRYCGCVRTTLEKDQLLADLLAGRLNEDQHQSVRRTVDQCSFASEP